MGDAPEPTTVWGLGFLAFDPASFKLTLDFAGMTMWTQAAQAGREAQKEEE